MLLWQWSPMGYTFLIAYGMPNPTARHPLDWHPYALGLTSPLGPVPVVIISWMVWETRQWMGHSWLPAQAREISD
jgi:hypothetical protein